MTPVSRRGMRLKKIAAAVLLCSMMAQAGAGQLHGVDMRGYGDVLRLSLETQPGTLSDIGINDAGTQLTLDLKEVDPDAVKKALHDLGLNHNLIRQIQVQPVPSKNLTRVTVQLKEAVDVLDETIAAVGADRSRWEIVLSRHALVEELAAIEVRAQDGRVTVLLRGGPEMQATASVTEKNPTLNIDFPKLSKAQLSRVLDGFHPDTGLVSSVQLQSVPKKPGTRLAIRLKRPMQLAEPELQRAANAAQITLALAEKNAPPAVPEPVVTTPATVAGPQLPAGVNPLPTLDLRVAKEPLGPLRDIPGLSLGRQAAAAVQAEKGLPGLDLREAMGRALDSDPKYKAARADFEAAREAVPQARAGYLPTATYDFQRTQTHQNATVLATGANSVRNYPITSNTLTITQPLIKLPAYVRMQQAKVSVEQGRINLVAAEQDLILRVASSYLNFLAAQDGLELARAEREATEKQAELARGRLSSGLGTVTQLYETEGRLGLTQAREVEAANKLDDARSALKEIIGVPVQSLKPFAGDFDAALPQPREVEPWVQAALEQNLSLQARSLASDIAALEVKRQQAGYAPSLNLVGTLGNNKQEDALVGGQFTGGYKANNRDLSVRFSMPLFEGGMTSSLVREAVARKQKADEERDGELRKTERQARSSLLGLVSSGQTLGALRKALAAQESALEAKSEGLKSGLYSIVQVVDAYRLYYSAKRDYLQARYDYLQNRLKLKQAVGTLSRSDLEDLASMLK